MSKATLPYSLSELEKHILRFLQDADQGLTARELCERLKAIVPIKAAAVRAFLSGLIADDAIDAECVGKTTILTYFVQSRPPRGIRRIAADALPPLPFARKHTWCSSLGVHA